MSESETNQPRPLVFSHAGEHDPAKVCVIAEIGVNHDGSLERAQTLIESAKGAGCDAVKFQYFRPERLLSKQAELAAYQQGSAKSAEDLLGKLTLSLKELKTLREAAREAGLGLVVTPFSLEDVEELADLELDAVKIASPDVINRPLIRRVLKLDKPVLISTGASEGHEISEAAEWLSDYEPGGALLQCVSSYPTPMEKAALGGIRWLQDRHQLPIGYSDHTSETLTGALAVAAGACLLEKHLTYDTGAEGPDHAASLNPEQMRTYVSGAREAAQALGRIDKSAGPEEEDVRRLSRQSLCLTRAVSAGDRLTAADLTIKRPGEGIRPKRLKEVLGRSMRRDKGANELLVDDDLI
ncbi:N-acetylneuraminate synthase family protein [Mucisphaera sp.]|uniref:N-acetylneuraminate synthase family protein n=1 Tax=Mucisphaera sp. TaxID=2913024 RepID=UPI003D0A800F